jgi:hypothetical protein
MFAHEKSIKIRLMNTNYILKIKQIRHLFCSSWSSFYKEGKCILKFLLHYLILLTISVVSVHNKSYVQLLHGKVIAIANQTTEFACLKLEILAFFNLEQILVKIQTGLLHKSSSLNF